MFSVKFEGYLKECNCSAKEFSRITNISEATVSRYRMGKTVPAINSGKLELIAETFEKMINNGQTANDIYEDLLVSAYEDLEVVDYRAFSKKLNSLIEALNIKKSKMADEIHVSSSYLSKICSEQVKPRNPVYIAEMTANYIVYNYTSEENRATIKNLIEEDSDEKAPSSDTEYYRAIRKWLLKGENFKSQIVDKLFYKYNEFDKNYYFDYQASANEQNKEPVNKNLQMQTFVGFEGLRKGFYTWMDVACDAKINDELIIYDEILSKIARSDPQYACEYADIVERLIKSGKTITIVHNFEHDSYIAAKKVLFWQPLIMSGRLTLRYVNEPKTDYYRNTLMVSSNCTFIGSVIENDYEHGHYMLAKGANEVILAKARAQGLVDHTKQTYSIVSGLKLFEQKMEGLLTQTTPEDKFIVYLPMPLPYSMREERLIGILERNCIAKDKISMIISDYRRERALLEMILQINKVTVFLNKIDDSVWSNGGITLQLSEQYFAYTQEDYVEHMKDTGEFVKNYPNMKFVEEKMYFYKNMFLMCVPGKFSIATCINATDVFMINEDKLLADVLSDLIAIAARDGIGNDPQKIELYNYIQGLMVKN